MNFLVSQPLAPKYTNRPTARQSQVNLLRIKLKKPQCISNLTYEFECTKNELIARERNREKTIKRTHKIVIRGRVKNWESKSNER